MALQFPDYVQGLSFADMLNKGQGMKKLRLENDLLGAQTPNVQAQTAQTVESTRLMPKDLDVKLISALNQREGNLIQRERLAAQNFMDTFGRMPEVTKLKMIQQNPELFNNLLKNSTTNAASSAGGQGNNAPYYNNIEQIISTDFPQFQPSHENGMTPGDLQAISLIQDNPKLAQGAANMAADNQASSAAAKGLADTASDKIIKDTIPGPIQDKRYYAENIQKTSATLNNYIDDAVQYAGHPVKWGVEQAKALAGLPVTPQFEQAQGFYNLIPQWAGQVRQYYGDSIQPHVKKDLEDLAEPSFWRGNPKLARQKYEGIMTLLAAERETTSSRPSQINDETYNNKKSAEAAEASKQAFNSVGSDGKIKSSPTGKVLVVSSDGKQGYVPEGRLNEYLKNGYKKR